MLKSYRTGFAVMGRDLNSYTFEAESFEECKRFCRNGDVIVEMIPYVNGISISFRKWPFWYGKLIRYDKSSNSLYIWKFQIRWNKEYNHMKGDIVYDSLTRKED